MSREAILNILVIFFLFSFSSCVQDITTETVVHDNGEIERTIRLTGTDSIKVAQNIFGLNATKGWRAEVQPSGTSSDGRPEFNVTLSKTYPSVNAANAEMNADNPNVFKIRSSFEKKFRWFYTYYEYSDSYVSLDRLDSVRQEDYFTREDYAFINRLPAEGRAIPRNDKAFLDNLEERIIDNYFTDEMVAQLRRAVDVSLKKNSRDSVWQREYNRIVPGIIRTHIENGSDKVGLQVLKDVIEKIDPAADTVAVFAEFRREFGAFEKRLSFLQDAASGKFTHIIKVPWNVIETNADSVAGNVYAWQPPTIKFYLQDYDMKITGRRLNPFPTILSIGLFVFTLFLFIKWKVRR